MPISEITIKNATFTIDSATKYRFDNNICNHILLRKRFSVLMWYQCGEHHMFLLLACYDTDDTNAPKTREEFLRGMAEMDTMYWFQSEHADIKELKLISRDNEIVRLAVPLDEDVENEGLTPWVINNDDDCLGIYRLEGDTLHLVYNNHTEAFQNDLKIWESISFVKLEWDKSDI